MKIHLDTDFGGDIDDLCALALALRWPGAELMGVTTILDDGGVRAGYARRALAMAGRPDVPVAAGADRALGCFRVPAEGPLVPDERVYWPEPVSPTPGPLGEALDLLAQSIAAGAVVVAIGGLTNLALLERRSPGILATAQLVVMGGYVYPPRAGYPAWGPRDDWNLQVDAPSACEVLASSAPLLVPLSVTVETALRRADLPALQQGDALARLIARQAEAFAAGYGYEASLGRVYPGLPNDLINFQHDPLAVALALGWREGVTIATLPLESEIVGGWLQQRIAPTGRPTRVVTAIDGPRFNEQWLALVAGRLPA